MTGRERVNPKPEVIERDSFLFRIHGASRDPLLHDLDKLPRVSRFSPLNGSVGGIYLGQSFAGAVVEMLLRHEPFQEDSSSKIFKTKLRGAKLTVFHVQHDLKVVYLHGLLLAALQRQSPVGKAPGVAMTVQPINDIESPVICASDRYIYSHDAAATIRTGYANRKIHGLLWHSRHLNTERAIVLWHDCCDFQHHLKPIGEPEELHRGPRMKDLRKLANQLGATIE